MRVGGLLRAPEKLFTGAAVGIGVVATAGVGAEVLAGGGLTTLNIARAAPIAAGGLSRLPRPETPGGMSLADFGQKVMQWGRGSADALARIGNITRDELEDAGVTPEMAKKWADFYVNEVARKPNNPSAAGRAELMKHVTELLK